MFALSVFFLYSLGKTSALVLPRVAPSQRDNPRTWESAVQNINGMNSILTLLPVLTGKVQNIKLVASRVYPASFVVAGIGAGRVLSKLQLGILLCSFELYRNTVADLSYAHDEYINRFAPTLLHLPTGTPERHSTKLIVNHNPAETYMVEAWFRTQGSPSVVELKQNNYTRIAVGFAIYIMLYAGETYLAVQNAATGTATLLSVVQGICVCAWLTAVLILQIIKGQGKPEVELNLLQSTAYRCFTLPTSGEYVDSEVFSFHLNNLNDYKLYASNYEQPLLAVAGTLILTSATLDILSTVLIVGLTTWAYGWIGLEVLILFTKVVFCVEPLREIEIKSAKCHGDANPTTIPSAAAVNFLPLKINLAEPMTCESVSTDHSIFRDSNTNTKYQSTTAGLFIDQEYTTTDPNGEKSAKYLSIGPARKLTLLSTKPDPQENQALQREFLAALKTVVEGNKIPSRQFIATIEKTLENMKPTMTPQWYTFGSKDVLDAIGKAKRTFRWRRFL